MAPRFEDRQKILIVLLLTAGLFLVGLAVFAYPLGLARDPKWGAGNTLLAAAGGLILSCGLVLLSQPVVQFALPRLRRRGMQVEAKIMQTAWIKRFVIWKENFNRKLQEWPAQRRLIQPVLRAVRAVRQNQTVQVPLVTVLTGILIGTAYLWFASVGFWTVLPKTTDYYDRLAISFRHGKVHLEDQPDPALMSLADPYEHDLRGNIPVLWDMTYYKGRYYLYWGPAPAVVLAIVRQFVANTVNDSSLTLGFMWGSFVFSILILLHFRARAFGRSPAWSLLLAVLTAGLANPMPWLLSRPAVYEAAIASGQFFYLGGFYAWCQAWSKPKPAAGYLALAGLLWAGAIGSRTVLVVGVAFLAFLSTARLWIWARQAGPLRKAIPGLICLGLPLVSGLAGLGWYNWARFGSFLETGHRYQITGMNLDKIQADLFSPANIWPNLHNYLINPFQRLDIFPFVKPAWGLQGIIFPFPVPKIFYSEQVTGLLPSAPFLLLALIPPAWLVYLWLRRLSDKKPPDPASLEAFSGLAWSVAGLAGGAILIFMVDLGYIFSTMRYLGDIVPSLALLASLGFWQGYAQLKAHAFWRKIFALAGTGLAIYTAAVGFLLAVTGYDMRFEHLNPDLFEKITRWLAW